MCGICGFNWDDKNLIKEMISTLHHRGPDDSGYFFDENISLGHVRLSIIDLSKKGKQPIHNEDNSIWIIFNGEIYNYREIKADLIKKGHIFYTNTDTEVIIHSYEEYGYDCLKQFNGLFAFCIYDSNKAELFLARDRFGIKPLYYYLKNNYFIFASEIKAILNYNLEKKINKEALREYFTYRFTIAPNTILEDIFKLKPSHYLIFKLKPKEIIIQKYFELTRINTNNFAINTIAKQLFGLLNDSVKLRMISDVPICTFLSGGIDSSIITGLASKYNDNINSYSVGFEFSSELKYAKIVSNYFNTNHHELIIKNEDVLKNIDKMIYYMDEPIGDAAFVPILLLSELVSKQFKVVLAGEGADEIFGGYDKYKMFFYGKKAGFFLPKLNYNQDVLKRLSRYSILDEKKGYLETIRVFTDEEMDKMNILPCYINKYWISEGDTFQKMQYFDIRTVLPEDFFMKADKMCSAYGLEERVPFMDYRLVSFAFNLPIKLKLHFWNEKYILKRTFSNFLPKEIIKRRKRGFNVPMDYWFKTILENRFIELLKENLHDLYEKKIAFELLKKMKFSGENYKKNFYLAQKLWTLYVFEEWYNKFMS